MWGLQAETYACVVCRIAQKRSSHCTRGHTMINMGRFWRAPKKNNLRAWQRVAQGDKLWDDKAIKRKAKRDTQKTRYRRGRWEK